MSKLTLRTEQDKYVVVTRRFEAPPDAVYRAHIDPKLIQQWMLGPEGWTMPVCINEARPAAKFVTSGPMERAEAFVLPVNFWNWCPTARSSMSSACTCPIPRRTTTSKPGSSRMERNVVDNAHDLARQPRPAPQCWRQEWKAAWRPATFAWRK